jgi:hypothetical protein
MNAFLESVCPEEHCEEECWIVRVGPHCYKMNDPYELAMLVKRTGPTTCELKALVMPSLGFKPDYWKAIQTVLVAAGFETATFDRIVDGKALRHTISKYAK